MDISVHSARGVLAGALAAFASVLLSTLSIFAAVPSSEITTALSADIGPFHQAQPIKPSDILGTAGFTLFGGSEKTEAFEAEYDAASGHKFIVQLVRFQSDSEA